MISRLFSSLAWRPSPAYVRFMREARRRSRRERRVGRALLIRAFIARHALLALVMTAVTTYAIAVPVVAWRVVDREFVPLRAQADRALHDAAAYRALALHLAVGDRGDGRVRVRLSAAGREEMLALLEQITVALKDERGEARP